MFMLRAVRSKVTPRRRGTSYDKPTSASPVKHTTYIPTQIEIQPVQSSKPSIHKPTRATTSTSTTRTRLSHKQHQQQHVAEAIAIKHFSRGLLRVAMYNDNARLPGLAMGQREPFAHVRHCPTGEISISSLLTDLCQELNTWRWDREIQVRKTAAHRQDGHDSDTESMDASYGSESELSDVSFDQDLPFERDLSPGMRVLLVAMVYIDRLTTAANGRARLCSETMHRLVLCAVQLAAQVMWSQTPNTKWFAAIAGVDRHEARQLKHLFCDIVVDLQVSTEQFQRCVSKCVMLIE